VTVTAADLTRATDGLRKDPKDWSAWLEVAAILAGLGAADDAELAFATIGEGARVMGRVALAVACGRHLAQLGSERGPELIDQVIGTYATGGPHFTFTTPPAPEEPPKLPAPKGDAIVQARAVIEQLGTWLTTRRPKQVPPAPLLSSLSQPGARALVGVMTAHAIAAGESIIQIGEPATALYWIAHGTVAIARPRRPRDDDPAGTGDMALGELHSGAFFGEIALVGGTTRTASVNAVDDVWLLEIPARAVESAASKYPKLAEVIAFHARARLLSNVMRTSALLRSIDGAARDELLAKFKSQQVAKRKRIITTGQQNDSLWVVVSGTVEVLSGETVLAELGPGAAVGEMSLISGAPANADVVATEPVVLLRLAKQDFDAVAKRHPTLLDAVQRIAVDREMANRGMFQDATDLIV